VEKQQAKGGLGIMRRGKAEAGGGWLPCLEKRAVGRLAEVDLCEPKFGLKGKVVPEKNRQ